MTDTTNTITTLRTHLFETLAALRDKENPMDIDRAKAVCLVAKEINDTARVEVDYLRVTGNQAESGFLASPTTAAVKSRTVPSAVGGIKHISEVPGGTVTTHKMR